MSGNVDKKLAFALKKETGAGISDCIEALKEANGDPEKAKAILRKKGYKVLAKRQEIETKNGYTSAVVSEDRTRGIIFALCCETDFVAKTDMFIKTCKAIESVSGKNFPRTSEELLNSITENGLTINEMIVDLAGKVGEKITLSHFHYIEAPFISSYNHYGNTISSVVAFDKRPEGMEEVAREIAIHVAAMNPLAVNFEDLPPEIIEKEKQIILEEIGSIQDEKIRENVLKGKLNKYLSGVVLMSQPFALDENISVKEYLNQKNFPANILKFIRIALGQ